MFSEKILLTVINLIAIFFILIISYDIVNYINHSKKKKYLRISYFLVALLLLSFVLNIFYLYNKITYLPIFYTLDKFLISVILLVIVVNIKDYPIKKNKKWTKSL